MESLLDVEVLLTDFEKWELTEKRKKIRKSEKRHKERKKIRDLEVFERQGYKPKNLTQNSVLDPHHYAQSINLIDYLIFSLFPFLLLGM